MATHALLFILQGRGIQASTHSSYICNGIQSTCGATLRKFIFSFLVGECMRMAICCFTFGGTVLYKLSSQHIHLTLFAASSAYTEPVASSMEHLHKLCTLGGKRKILSQERVLKTSNMGMLLLQYVLASIYQHIT